MFRKAWSLPPLTRWRQTQSWLSLKQEEPVVFVIACAVALSTIIQLMLMLFQMMSLPADFPLSQAFEEHLRLMGKQGLYGTLFILALIEARRRGWNVNRSLNLIGVFLALLTVYVIVQRYTGINWVHGFSSRLPENRLAYDVYRISGFMGHPLTFAYNLMLFSLLCFAFAIHPRCQRSMRWKWALCAALAFFCLFISGSRWPLLITGSLMALFSIRKIFLSRWFWLGLLISVIWVGFFDRGVVNRFLEPLQSNQRIEERFPRLVFWKVHWAMFQDEPLIGTGYANNEGVRLDYYDKAGYTEFREKYPAHNIFLQTLADSGIVGFMSLLSLLTGVLIAGFIAWKRQHFTGLLLVGMATILAGLMQNNLRDSEYLFALWACIAWYIAARKEALFESGSQIQNLDSRTGDSYHQSDVRRQDACLDSPAT